MPPSQGGAPARPPMSAGWLAAQGRLPLAFMGLALGWMVAAAALLATRPELLALSHLHPQFVALAHAWVLGVFVTAACGAAYQLAPVALVTTLWSERLGWWHFGLHATATPVMVHAFWRGDFVLLGLAGSFVAAGLLLFGVNTWKTVAMSGRRGTVAWSLVLGAGWLALTALVGLLLAVNRARPFLAIDPLAFLRAHAHLGIVGFFLTLLQGVGFQLVPMFTLGEVRDWRLANAGLWLTQAGLVVLAPALAWAKAPLALAGAVAIVGGLSCSGVGLRRALATRKKRALDPGVRAFLWGAAGIGVAAVAALPLVAPGTPWGSAPGGYGATPYAILVVAGGLLPCIAGMMCKVVPFLTWMRAYGPQVGRMPTPPAGALTRPRIERWGLGCQLAAVLPLLAGAWWLDTAWLRAGAWLLAAGVALLAVDMLGVLAHLRVRPPPPRGTTDVSR